MTPSGTVNTPEYGFTNVLQVTVPCCLSPLSGYDTITLTLLFGVAKPPKFVELNPITISCPGFTLIS